VNKRAAKTEPPLVEWFEEIVQGSDEWFALHLGIPSASRFKTVIANGKDGTQAGSLTRQDLMRVLAGEVLTGKLSEKTFENDAMRRGREWESHARDWYERTRLVEVKQVGFVRRRLPSGRFVGCSPDGIISETKALEIKTTRPDLLIQMSQKGAGGFPSEHRAQCQGTLWVAGLQEIDLVIYSHGMPYSLVFSLRRDEDFIRTLSNSVEIFDFELHRLVADERRKA
jgi:hypothetical protein